MILRTCEHGCAAWRSSCSSRQLLHDRRGSACCQHHGDVQAFPVAGVLTSAARGHARACVPRLAARPRAARPCHARQRFAASGCFSSGRTWLPLTHGQHVCRSQVAVQVQCVLLLLYFCLCTRTCDSSDSCSGHPFLPAVGAVITPAECWHIFVVACNCLACPSLLSWCNALVCCHGAQC